MTQTLPLSIVTNRTGLLLGYTVLNLARTEYAAFTTTGVVESSVPGTYYKTGGYSAPDAGGYVVVSESDGGNPAVLTALAEAAIEPKVVEINSVLGSVGSVSSGVTIAGTLGTLDALWIKIQKWLRLGFRKDAAVATDHATELSEINADAGAGAGDYSNAKDSQEAIRDRGDTVWISGSAPSAADIDIVLSKSHGAGAWGASMGVFTKVYTVSSGGLPVDGVYCRLTTDLAGLANVDAGTTNAAGQITFHHNLPAGTTVYIHRSKAGYTPVAPEPDVEVI